MSKLTWKEYYKNFDNWELSTQKNYSYRLENYGSTEEVFNLLIKFLKSDKNFGNNFLNRLIIENYKFSKKQVLCIINKLDNDRIEQIIKSSKYKFNKNEMDYLSDYVNKDILDYIKNNNTEDINDNSEYLTKIKNRHLGYLCILSIIYIIYRILFRRKNK